MVKIESFPLEYVLANDRKRFNTNNFWPNDIPPDDYEEVLSRTNTCEWIDILKSDYSSIMIPKKHLLWMVDAQKIGCITGSFPKSYEEELNDTVTELSKLDDIVKNLSPCFIRTETVSLKYGLHGSGPYNNLRSIIESLVTSTSGHLPVKDASCDLKLYIIPWEERVSSSYMREFRVFVHDKKIRAVSQQHIYDVNTELNNMNDKEVNAKVDRWLNSLIPCITMIIDKIDISFALDIILLGSDDLIPYPIELNSFGKEYASGAALFCWEHDYNILYNSDEIHFRYTKE